MNELEVMKHAKAYLDLLAQGIDPIGGAPLPPNTFCDSERLSRCFVYVSGILAQVIANGGVIQRPKHLRAEKAPFSILPEQKERVKISETSATLSNLIALINIAAGAEPGSKLTYRALADGMEEMGFLCVPQGSAAHSRVPTPQGAQLGILRETRVNEKGQEYQSNLYAKGAQQFILDNLEGILEAAKLYGKGRAE